MTIGASLTQCGNAPSAASSTSWTLTTTAALDVGEVGVLRVALDNITATDGDNSEVASVTGGSGTWEKLGEFTNSQGAAAAGVTASAWLFTPSASNAVGTVFTITLVSARTQKIAALEKWTVGAGSGLRQTTESAPVTSQVDAGAGFGSSTYSGLSSAERLYLRVLGGEISTTASVAATSGFTALSSFRSSTSSPVSVLGEFRVNTSTGETSNPSFTPTADKVGIFFALEEYSTGGGGTVTGTLSTTLEPVVVSAQSSLPVSGSASASFNPLVVSTQGVLLVAGIAGVTLGPVTLSAASKSGIAASVTTTLGAVVTSATSKLTITAIYNLALGSLTVGASGGVESTPPINANASSTLSPVQAVGVAKVSISAVGFATLGQVTSEASGKLAIQSTTSTTLGLLSVVATGTSVALPAISASTSIALSTLRVAADSELHIKASATATLSDVSLVSFARNGVLNVTPAPVKRTLILYGRSRSVSIVPQARRVAVNAQSRVAKV